MKPDGINASKRFTFNVKNIDKGEAIKSLAKSVLHFAFLKNASASVNDLSKFLEALGANPAIDRLAYRLYITAMEDAIANTIKQIGTPVTDKDDENLARALDQLPETFWFDKKSIDEPADSQFYKDMENCLIDVLGDDKKDKGFVRNTLRYFFVEALQAEWRNKTAEYQKLDDYFNTPFDEARAKEECWINYANTLNERVSASIYNECYGLKDIYVPLNVYCTDENNQTKHGRESEETTRYVHDLDTLLNDWLNNVTSNDAYRIISGEPGSGKSTVAKMFAANRINDMHLVYVPLDVLDLRVGFKEAFETFLRVEKLPTDLLDKDQNLLIILDGLDELTEQKHAAARTARDFVHNVMRAVDTINNREMYIRVLFTGRIPAVQEAEGLFNDRTAQILHLLPYHGNGSDSYAEKNYQYSHKKLKKDKRLFWWERYAQATNKPIEMPKALLDESIDHLTSSPLLLHLVALHYDKEGNVPENKAELYSKLLEGVFRRAPKDTKEKRHPINRFTEITEYMDALSDVAMAMWHNTGRKVSLATAAEYCKENGRETLLQNLSATAKADDGITNVFMMFYGRRVDYVDGNATFEFTHKSFGEYLIARRIVETLKTIANDLTSGNKHYNIEDALMTWTKICGQTTLDMDIADLIRDHVAYIADKEKAGAWQNVLCQLISYVTKEGMPFGKERPATLKEEQRIARNSEIALLVAHSACARVTDEVLKIDWEDEYAASTWIKWLQANQPFSRDIAIVNQHLNHLNLNNCIFRYIDLGNGDFTCTCFTHGDSALDFSHADFFESNFHKTHFCNVEFHSSHIGMSYFNDVIFDNVFFYDANIYDTTFDNTDLSDVLIEASKLHNVLIPDYNIYLNNTIIVSDDTEINIGNNISSPHPGGHP